MRYGCVLPLAGMALFLAAWGLLGPYIDWHGKLVFAGNIALVLVIGGAALTVASRFGLRDWTLRVLALALPLCFVGCQAVTYPEFNFRVKVIVTLEADGREITEEAVWNYHSAWQLFPLPDVGGGESGFTGDALVFDIGGERQIAITKTNFSNAIRDGFQPYYTQNTGQTPGRDRELPFLAMFVGRGGPRSVLRFEAWTANLPPGIRRPIPPASVKRFLYFPASTSPDGFQRLTDEQLLTLGVKIKKIEIETTDETIKRNIENRLRWYENWHSKFFSGSPPYFRMNSTQPDPYELRN
jgi:hypothetical protein